MKHAPSFSVTNYLKQFRHLVTIQNAGLVVALVIAAGWVWGAVGTLQRNYQYQRQVDENNARIELAKLQNKTLAYQQAYYKSDEYLELMARVELGKAQPGERLVLLPPSAAIKDTVVVKSTTKVQTESNFARWMDFLFGPRP